MAAVAPATRPPSDVASTAGTDDTTAASAAAPTSALAAAGSAAGGSFSGAQPTQVSRHYTSNGDSNAVVVVGGGGGGGGAATGTTTLSAADVARGRVLLKSWQAMMTPRAQLRHLVLFWSAFFFLSFPLGVVVLNLFDADNSVYAWPMLSGGGVFSIVGVWAFLHLTPPAVFGRLAHFPAAAAEAAKIDANERSTTTVLFLMNVAVAGLFVLFITSDLSGRGGAHASEELRRAAVVMMLAVAVPTAIRDVAILAGCSCRPMPVALTNETPLQLLQAAAKALADSAEAGMPVRELERDLLAIREIVTMLRGAALTSLGFFLAWSVWSVASIAVCVTVPDPPAMFVYDAVSMVSFVYLAPLRPAQVDMHLRRIPVALSVRACRAPGDGDADADVKATAKAGKVGEVLAGDAGGDIGGGDVEGGAATAAVKHRSGGGTRYDDVDAMRREQQALRQQLHRQQVDLLRARIPDLRLGWYVVGVPVTNALLARVRGLAVAVTILFVRDAVGF